MPTPADLLTVLWRAGKAWLADNAPRLGAALAYYAVFSLAPILALSIALAGLVLGEQAVESELRNRVAEWLGPANAQFIHDLVSGVQVSNGSLGATVAGLVTVALGALGLSNELQEAFNQVWGITRPANGVRGQLIKRAMSLVVVLITGLLLALSVVLTTVLQVITQVAADALADTAWWWALANLGAPWLLVFGLCALLYRIVPDAPVAWGDVWFGAAVAAVLLTVARYGLSLYLGVTAVTSVYGAAGSLVAILIWVYFSAQIMLYGAECTRIYAEHLGSRAIAGLRAPAGQVLGR